MVRKYRQPARFPQQRTGSAAAARQRLDDAPLNGALNFTAQVLQGWSELKPELREKMFAMLQARSWLNLLPAEADRSKLPGFLTRMAKG